MSCAFSFGNRAVFILAFAAMTIDGNAQFTQTAGFYRTTTSGTGLATPAKGMQIGGAPNTAQGAAFTVRADQTADPATTLGEAFRTVVRHQDGSYWRMFRRNPGTNLSDILEVGRVYNNALDGHFRVDASVGQLHLQSSGQTRLAFLPTGASATVNSYSIDQSGFALLGGGNSITPWSVFHLSDGSPGPQEPYREWMSKGLIATSSARTLSFGVSPYSAEPTVQWGGTGYNPRLRFQYTAANGSQGDAGTIGGKNIMTLDKYGVRIGGFELWWPNEQPALTVNGHLALMDQPYKPWIDRILVLGDTGVVGYSLIEDLLPNDLLQWHRHCDGMDNIVTAWDNQLGYPWEGSLVGIGLCEPSAKLHVRRIVDTGGGAVQVTTLSENPLTADNNIAMQAYCSPPSPSPTSTEYGLHSLAQDGYTNYGVHSTGWSNSAMGDLNVGVFGRANCTHPGQKAFGIWGVGQADAPCAAYAAWFDGNVLYTGETVHVADLNVKTNIVPLSGASNLIAQLLPKRFNFNTGAFPNLRLPAGPHMGLLAQDVEAVIPGLVKDVERPGVYSSNGALMEAPVTTKTVNYTELITLLIAAFKEQQARFNTVTASLQSQITALSNTVNSCCQGGGNFRSVEQVENGGGLLAVPNPFSGATVLHYGLEAESEVRLVVLDGAGQLVQEIFAGTLPAGEHQAEWRAGDVAAGLYHVTLWVNDKAEIGTVLKVSE